MSSSSILVPTKLNQPPKEFINVVSDDDAWEGEEKTSAIADNLPPGDVEIHWLISYLGLTENSIKMYRDVALQHSEAYQLSIAQKYGCSDFQEAELKLSLQEALGQKVPRRIDAPPFSHPQAIILIAIARLFEEHGLKRRVINAIKSDQYFYRKFTH